MKKYFLVVFCALVLFVVTGCGSKNQVKCSGKLSEGEMNILAEVIADFDKDDKLTDATISYELDDEDTATQYCSLFKLMQDEEKGVTVTCSGKKITIKGYANLDSEEEEDSVVGKTKEEFIKYMQEEEKLTCK